MSGKFLRSSRKSLKPKADWIRGRMNVYGVYVFLCYKFCEPLLREFTNILDYTPRSCRVLSDTV